MTQYLINFFEALMRLSQRSEDDLPHKIDYEYGSLCVLVNMGDLWARIPLEGLDEDPAKAAENVFRRWSSLSGVELEKVLEGR